MQKLYTTLFGSRLYGTQTPTSDLDLKHVVLPELDHLLLAKRVENKVKKTNHEKHTRNSADDVDEEFIPLQQFARHFVEGQTYAIELAFSVDGTHAQQTFWTFDQSGESEHEQNVYSNDRKDHLFYEFVTELRARFLTSNIKAMMGYVVNQASLYSFKGERLNVTREVKAVFESAARSFVGVRVGAVLKEDKWFSEKIDELLMKYPKYFRKAEYDIGGGVLRPCFLLLEKTIPFTDRVEHSLHVIGTLESKYGSRADAASESNVDWKATMHALRIVDEGLKLLGEYCLEFPFNPDYVAHLLAIKRGELPLDPIKDELSAKLEMLKELEKTTKLPAVDRDFNDKFETWLVGWVRKFYGV